MLKAGSDPKGAVVPEPGYSAFRGLGVGRIVHVCLRLPVAGQPVVERPAIVTSVLCKERGIISAHIFKVPDDPPGETIVYHGDRAGEPLGAKIPYQDPGEAYEPWTWHWPERVD
ncbi:MAG: hypothetical protein KJN79_00130 [Gammaproteobacteria bacterium]|nr:hypothetical protein [Gammaproteobacteria bacterium]